MALPRLLAKLRLSGHTITRAALGIVIAGVLLAHHIRHVNIQLLEQFENIAYDSRLRLFMPKTADKHVVIIDIDEKSLQAEGRWPWNRAKVAQLVKNSFEKYQARVVGFDVLFGEADESSGLPILEDIAKGQLKDDSNFQRFMAETRPKLDYDRILADEIKKYPVVLGIFISNIDKRSGALPPPTFRASQLSGTTTSMLELKFTGYAGNLPILQENAAGTGHMYPAIDDDGTTRRVPMFSKLDDAFYDALSLAMLRVYLDTPPVELQPPSDRRDGAVKLGNVKIPLDINLASLVPYRGPRGVFPYVSATDIIRGTADPNALRDKAVLVGTSAQGLLDLRTTPVQADLPGVEVHANLISGALEGRILSKPITEFSATGIIILVLGLLLAIALPLLNPIRATIVFLAVLLLLVTFNLYMWRQHLFVMTLATPLVMVVAIYFLNMAYGFFTESRSKRLITARFGEYIPKELVDEMAKDPVNASMEGESREMTVLFSDVRNFTTISESLAAAELSRLMNAYLTPMTEVIQAERGTIDKYIGDAIMCFWGAPLRDHEHARRGVTAALAMQKRLRELWPDFESRGWPKLEIGVGLNTGEMRVGNMGSQFRRAYTVMGDAVNLGARLEGITKVYGVGVLVSEFVVRAAPQFVYRELDRIRVKGKLEPVTVYEPIGPAGEVDSQKLDEIDLFHRALDRFREQRWDDAEMLLMRVQRVAPDSKSVKLYLDRIGVYRRSPPGAQWDGVTTFETK